MRTGLAALLFLAFGLVQPAGAAGKDTLDAGYTIAFWTIAFGHTDYHGTFRDGGYSAASHFETTGIISAFWKSIIDATVSGRFESHGVKPLVYDSYNRRSSKKVQQVKVSFTSPVPETYANPPYNTTKYPVSDQLKKEAVDPMSAITMILAGLRASDSNPCGSGVQVFDGRRRYDVTFTYLRDEPAKLDNGMFSGVAHLCQIHYRQIAGYKQKILKEGEALPPMFAWCADVPSASAPNGHLVVPLKLWSTLTWGTVSATLDSLKVDGSAPDFSARAAH